MSVSVPFTSDIGQCPTIMTKCPTEFLVEPKANWLALKWKEIKGFDYSSYHFIHVLKRPKVIHDHYAEFEREGNLKKMIILPESFWFFLGHVLVILTTSPPPPSKAQRYLTREYFGENYSTLTKTIIFGTANFGIQNSEQTNWQANFLQVIKL